MTLDTARARLIGCGRLLWDKDLASGFNGNLSLRLDAARVLVTGRGTCLGLLRPEDLVLVGMDGAPLDGGEPSSETRLHLDIYRALPQMCAVVHTHTTFTNAFFLSREEFRPATTEAEHMLGVVPGIVQHAVNVEDTAPVVEALRTHRMVALRRHGIVAPGVRLLDGVARIQVLEEQIKMEAVSRLFREG